MTRLTRVQSDWTRLRENDVFKHRIPLPQSNSNVAKKMRVAMILSTLARLVDKFIFQPTFLLREDSGLREILRQQAIIDPTKERYTRGVLLSMSPDEQEANVKEGVKIIVQDLLDTVDVGVLLPPETLATFEKELESFITQFQDEWKVVKCGKQKLEPSFTYYNSTDRPWHVFDMEVPGVKNRNHTEQPLATSNMIDDIVIFRRVHLMGTEAESE